MKYVKEFAILIGITLLWIAISIYGALSGWWLTPIAPKDDTQAFIHALKEKMHTENHGNTAFILIENNEVITEDYSASVDVVDRNTLFPLASMSKLFTAYGVMQLVEAGKISLDAPINSYLTRWQLPESNLDSNQVTMRQLLSHTSGLTDGLGFGDYEPNEVIPPLEASLSNPRATNGNKTIELGLEPGTEWKYSGGGYLVIQLVIEEITGMNFESWMQQSVFSPLKMTRSTYKYLGDLENISKSYNTDGQLATLYRYASSAATGLSSTPADLMKFVKALSQSISDNRGALSYDNVETMRHPLGKKMGAAIWGMGVMLYAPISGGDFVFGHGGANDPAINTELRVNPASGDAIIVLVTGSKSLASSAAYEWTLWQTGYPDFLMFKDKAMKSAQMPSIIGVLFILICYLLFFLKRRNSRVEI
jgi:CubicO group peptidase (beta-lactamase class C family)